MNNDKCCPEFNPEIWDNKTSIWNDKPFLKDEVRQVFHIPLNFPGTVKRMFDKIKEDHNYPEDRDFLILAYDPSPWKSELYMTINEKMAGSTTISGEFYSKVFEGPYKEIPNFCKQMQDWGEKEGKKIKKIFFHFPYCPKCAKEYEHNYIVAFAEIDK